MNCFATLDESGIVKSKFTFNSKNLIERAGLISCPQEIPLGYDAVPDTRLIFDRSKYILKSLKNVKLRNNLRILILRKAARGDLLIMHSALEYFLEENKSLNVEIAVAIDEPILGTLTYFENVKELVNPIKPIESGFDLVLDVRNSYTWWQDVAETKTLFGAYLKRLGLDWKDKRYKQDLKIIYSEKEIEKAKQLLNQLDFKKEDIVIGLQPFSRRSESQWHYWKELVNYLSQKYNTKFLVFGTAKDKLNFENTNLFSLIGKTSFLEASAVIGSRCNGFISIDSGLLYSALAQKIPSLNIWCRYDWKQHLPDLEYSFPIQSPVECSPCCWVKAKRECKGRDYCIDGVTVEFLEPKIKEFVEFVLKK